MVGENRASLGRWERALLPLSVGMLLWLPLLAKAEARRIGGPPARSLVPAWDARGLGPLPWQGVSCAAMTADGRYVAVGTMAPPGDPHVFLLGPGGELVGQYRAGERWIEAVAVGEQGAFVAACCATPAGTSGDRPVLKVFAKKELERVSTAASDALPQETMFHYGDHSNHLPQAFRAAADRLVIASSQRLLWLSPGLKESGQPIVDKNPSAGQVAGYGKMPPGALSAFATNGRGRAVVGLAVNGSERREDLKNLVVVEAGRAEPLWRRPVLDEVAVPPEAEAGVYGPGVPPHEDLPAWAPLAVAIDPSGRLVASADYAGQKRVFRGSPRDYAVRFPPSRPTISVYDAEGKLVRRFPPEKFAEPFWCDLAFTPDGKKLLAFAHNWTSRGLGGQGILPADDDARLLYALDIPTGNVEAIEFADALSGVAVAGDGKVVVGCWNRRVYLLDAKLQPIRGLEQGIEVGSASLVQASREGSRFLTAGTDGVVRMFDGQGRPLWQTDLNAAARPGNKPWTRNQRLRAIAEGEKGRPASGVWQRPGVRAHSDLGNQFIVEAPEGLLLIDPNAGLSIEHTWAAMEGSGLDPRKVKYVLLTHEHGDHAPGAYLWRILTGAQVVASPEMAYQLRRHMPEGSGYGFHPPQPVDVLVDKDQELTLAGLTLNVVRLPGHTYGSLGYLFERGGRRYAALGDLIMPGGRLGYWGSLDFSAADVLASLRKLQRLAPDVILGGHGIGPPEQFIARGIAAGEATGWGKMRPEKPDPLFGFAQRNYLIVGWLEPILAAACGDIDGDGPPDVAILTRQAEVNQVKIFLNHGGAFASRPDLVQEVPDLGGGPGVRLRLIPAAPGRPADLLAAGERQAALLLAREGKLACRVCVLADLPRGNEVLADGFERGGRRELLIGQRFIRGFSLAVPREDGLFRVVRKETELAPYFNGRDRCSALL